MHRPAPNLPLFGKIIEQLLTKQLQDNISVLDPFQSGFRADQKVRW